MREGIKLAQGSYLSGISLWIVHSVAVTRHRLTNWLPSDRQHLCGFLICAQRMRSPSSIHGCHRWKRLKNPVFLFRYRQRNRWPMRARGFSTVTQLTNDETRTRTLIIKLFSRKKKIGAVNLKTKIKCIPRSTAFISSLVYTLPTSSKIIL